MPSQSDVTTVSTEEVVEVAGVDDEVSVEVIVEVEEVSVDEVIVEVEDASVEEVIVELEDVGDDCAVSTKDTELGTLKQMSIVNIKC